MKKRWWVLLLLIFLLPAAIIFSYRSYYRLKQAKNEQLILQKRTADWLALEKALAREISGFRGEAGIVVKDLNSGREISFDKDKLFPSASLAKVPLMAGSFLASAQSKIKLNRNIALKSADKLTGSGVLKDMPAGTVFSLERLIGLMIYDSDNTATNIVTKLIGIDYLNSAFEAFGLKHTRLSRKIADYRARDKGRENYTTAGDMALLFEKIYLRTLGDKNISDRCIDMLKLSRINDRIPKYLPVNLTIAHKTGLERGICHDAGIVFSCKGDFIIVALVRHAHSSSAPAKEFIARIALLAYNYFEKL